MICPKCGSRILLIFMETSRTAHIIVQEKPERKEFRFTKIPHGAATSEIGIHFVCSANSDHDIMEVYSELLNVRQSFIDNGPLSR